MKKFTPAQRRIMSRRSFALGATALLERVAAANRGGRAGDLRLTPQLKAIFTLMRKEIEERYAREMESGIIAE